MEPVSQNSMGLRWEDQPPKELIRLQIHSQPCSPEVVVSHLVSTEGALDIYFWYEGNQCLPKSGADFLKKSLLQPIYEQKKDAKLNLYSLKAWDFIKDIGRMPSSTPIGEAINRINKSALECMYSSSFFHYCANQNKNSLYHFLSTELPNKKWLLDLSAAQKKKGMTVGELFNQKSSLFDCIKDLDISQSYSPMQYVEGYYLIQQSVEKGLSNGQRKIQIAFVLPNDEGKYYLDYPHAITQMLQIDFGSKISGVEIDISFRFFEYGSSSIARPYIDKRKNAPRVEANQIDSYFDFVLKADDPPRRAFLRDVIHNLNGWDK